MIWVAQRRFRFSVIAVVAMLLLLFVVMTFSGIQLLHDYDVRAASCSARMDCVWVQRYFSTFRFLGHVWSALLLVAPALAGVLWGTMAAQDFASDDVRSLESPRARRRWITRRLLVVTTVVVVLLAALSAAVTWWQSPLDRFYDDPFHSIDVRGIAPVAYTAFAVVLGALLGVVVRRTSVAVISTLGVFAAVRALVDWAVRPHLLPAVVAKRKYLVRGLGGGRVTTTFHVERGAWVFGRQVATGSGRVLGAPIGIGRGGLYGIHLHKGIATIPGVGRCPGTIPGASSKTPWHPGLDARLALERCIGRLHLHQLVTYLPTSRYWPLQSVESAIYVVLAIVLGVVVVGRAANRLESQLAASGGDGSGAARSASLRDAHSGVV